MLERTGEQGCERGLASSYWTAEGSELCTEQPGRKAEKEGRRGEREKERERPACVGREAESARAGGESPTESGSERESERARERARVSKRARDSGRKGGREGGRGDQEQQRVERLANALQRTT